MAGRRRERPAFLEAPPSLRNPTLPHTRAFQNCKSSSTGSALSCSSKCIKGNGEKACSVSSHPAQSCSFYEGLKVDPTECCSGIVGLRDALLESIANAFAKYAVCVFKHPKKFIFFSCFISLAFSSGAVMRKELVDGETQYTLPNSQAQQDSTLYREIFGWNVTRSEVLLVAAADGRSNLLQKTFLDRLWNLHGQIMDLQVSADDLEGDALAAAAAAKVPEVLNQIAKLRVSKSPASFLSSVGADTKQDASRSTSLRQRLLSALLHNGISERETEDEFPETRSQSGNLGKQTVTSGLQAAHSFSNEFRFLRNRQLAGLSPEQYLQQQMMLQQLQQLKEQNEPGHQTARQRSVQGASTVAPPRSSSALQESDTRERRTYENDCNVESQPLRTRVLGLACKPPTPPGVLDFRSICLKDSFGGCVVPDGILFFYNSPRYQLTDHPSMRPFALAWERRLAKLLDETSLPGAVTALKTERSLCPSRPSAAEAKNLHGAARDFADFVRPFCDVFDSADELASATSGGALSETALVIISGVLVSVYIAVVGFSRSFIRSKTLVGLSGGLAAALGFGAGSGLCFFCGIPSTAAASAAPFLVLGIGLDDALLLLQAYSLTAATSASSRSTFTFKKGEGGQVLGAHQQISSSKEASFCITTSKVVAEQVASARLRQTLRDAGIGMTVTTLTNLLSFAAGAASPYPSIRSFCCFAAAGLFFGYLNCLSLFLGCLAIDARNEELRRVPRVFKCIPMQELTDSLVPKKQTPTGRPPTNLRLVEKAAPRPGHFQLHGIRTLQYVDKTKRVQQSLLRLSCEASSSSAKAAAAVAFPVAEEDAIFHCITQHVEAALAEQEQHRLQAEQNKRQRQVLKERKKRCAKQTKKTNCPAKVSSGKPRRNGRGGRGGKAGRRRQGVSPFKDSQISSAVSSSETCESEKTASLREESKRRPVKKKQLRMQAKAKDKKKEGALKVAKGGGTSSPKESKTNPQLPNSPATSRRRDTLEGPSEESHSSHGGKRGIPVKTASHLEIRRFRRTTVRFGSLSVKPKPTPMRRRSQRDASALHTSEVLASSSSSSREAALASGSWSAERIARLQLLRRLQHSSAASPSLEPHGNIGRRMRRVLTKLGALLLLNPYMKLLLLLVLFAMMVVAVVGCAKLQSGLDPKSLTGEDAPLSRFFRLQEKFFGSVGEPVMVFFAFPEALCSAVFRVEYDRLVSRLKESYYTHDVLDGLLAFLASPLASQPQPDKTCFQMLFAWLQTPFGLPYAQLFSWADNYALRGFSLVLIPRFFSSTRENAQFMQSLRNDLSTFPLSRVYAHSPNFLYFESDAQIIPQAVSCLGMAGCAVILVSLVLLPSIRAAIIVVVILFLIDIFILGVMSLWGLSLNLLTLVNLTISIGFSVDFSTHVVHAFCHCLGPRRDQRAYEALLLVGSALLHGGLTTLLAVLPLGFTRTPVLVIFFKMTVLVVLTGVTFGVFLLPVILSLIGPQQQQLQQRMLQQLLLLQEQRQALEDLESEAKTLGDDQQLRQARKQRHTVEKVQRQLEIQLLQQQQTVKETLAEFVRALIPAKAKRRLFRAEL